MFVTKLNVKETSEGKAVWEGVVHIFDLEGNAKSTRAYAWSSPIEGSDERRFHAVLHLGGIRSPLDAVRAAIVAEGREKRGHSSIGRASGCNGRETTGSNPSASSAEVCREPDPLHQGAELELAGHRMPDSHSCTRLLAPL